MVKHDGMLSVDRAIHRLERSAFHALVRSSSLALAASLVACAPTAGDPPRSARPTEAVTQQSSRRSNDLPGQEGPVASPPAYCVDVWPEVRFRNYAYDHVVHLLSRCDVPAFCAVSSDVNPTTVQVEVPPREHVEVLTFRGSPARQFTPRVTCRFVV